MNYLDTLRAQVTTISSQMEAIYAPARAESRALTDDERTRYDELEPQLATARADLARAEAHERLQVAGSTAQSGTEDGNDPTPEPARARNLGQHFVNAVGDRLQGLNTGDNGSRFSVAAPAFVNAATDPQVTDGNTGGLGPVLTQVEQTVVEAFRRPLVIADLLASGTLDGQAITYFVEGAMEGDFSTVGENGKKPQMHFINPTAVTDALKKIAGYIKESDEMITDLPFLVSAINTRLLYRLGLFEENQVLDGDGVGTNLRGLLRRSGIQTMGASADAKTDNPDKLFRARTAVSTATGFEADGIVIHPTDYQALRLAKDGNQQYYGGGFFAGQYGIGGVPVDPPLWGLRTVVTPAIAQGTVAVGAFRAAATLYRKGGVRVEATNSNEDDFVNNRVTIRAEERVALAVRVPSAIVKVTLGAA